jgi:hypothetical protein
MFSLVEMNRDTDGFPQVESRDCLRASAIIGESWDSGLLLGNFGTLFSSFGKPYCNRLLTVLYRASFAPFSRTKGTFLCAANRACNSLAGRFAVLAVARFLPRTGLLFDSHGILLGNNLCFVDSLPKT